MYSARERRRRLQYYLEAPLRFRRLVIVPVAAGLVLGAAIGVLVPAEYRAASLLRADFDPEEMARLARAGVDVPSRRLSVVRRRVSDEDLLRGIVLELSPYAAQGLPPAEQVARLASRLRVYSMASSAYVVELSHSDPHAAARLVDRVVDRLVSTAGPPGEAGTGALERRVADARQRLADKALARARADAGARGSETASAKLARTQAAAEHEQAQREYRELLEQLQAAAAGPAGPDAAVRFERLRAAEVPRRAARSAWLALVVGGAVGLVCGLIASLVAEHRDLRVKGPEDLERMLPLPVLATVPAFTGRDERDVERGGLRARLLGLRVPRDG